MKRTLLASIVALGAVLVVAHGAHAGDESNAHVYLTVKPPDEKDPAQKGKAPKIEATIKNTPNVPAEKITISTVNPADKQRVTIKAEKKREYDQGTDRIAIALVLNGAELWVGNDKVETLPDAQYPGVLDKLEAAIDQMGLAKAGPPGSKAVVISYNVGAKVVTPMDDLAKITGGALGTQQDYYKKIGTDMVQGIELAYKELKNVATERKAMIIVGDGTDTDPDKAKQSLAELKKDCAAQNIDVFAIVYVNKTGGDDKPQVISSLVVPKTVNSVDGIQAGLADIVAHMADRFYVTFPGFDDAQNLGLPWDGKNHDLVIKLDQTELEGYNLTLPVWDPPKKAGFPWLIVILSVVGLILLIVIIKVATRKPAPAPMPMPVAMAPAPAEAPKPAGPMKTVMMSAGGDQDGFPIVGWLVPMNGVDAYKTMRLRSGLTKIGTAPPADIVINDGFMSTEHCQITSSPSGFTLLDNGSTNGSMVNDRKVQKHDLVDNDVITLGRTTLKFKSIN